MILRQSSGQRQAGEHTAQEEYNCFEFHSTFYYTVRSLQRTSQKQVMKFCMKNHEYLISVVQGDRKGYKDLTR